MKKLLISILLFLSIVFWELLIFGIITFIASFLGREHLTGSCVLFAIIIGFVWRWFKGVRKCPFCQKNTPADNNICQHCGKDKKNYQNPGVLDLFTKGMRTCPFCKKKTASNEKACRECGRAIDREPRSIVESFSGMRKCPYCGHNTSAYSKICQFCEKDIETYKPKHGLAYWIFVWILVIIIILFTSLTLLTPVLVKQ